MKKKISLEELNLEELQETLEAVEDTVECRECFELFPKEQCHKVDTGYICDGCCTGEVVSTPFAAMDLDFPDLADYDVDTHEEITQECSRKHNDFCHAIDELIADEVEAVEGYEIAKSDIAASDIPEKAEVLRILTHIEEEEYEHLTELDGITAMVQSATEERADHTRKSGEVLKQAEADTVEAEEATVEAEDESNIESTDEPITMTEDGKPQEWTCFFKDVEVGIVVASNEAEALDQMMKLYPEYPYGDYDGCFYVEPTFEELTEGPKNTAKNALHGIKKFAANSKIGKATAKAASALSTFWASINELPPKEFADALFSRDGSIGGYYVVTSSTKLRNTSNDSLDTCFDTYGKAQAAAKKLLVLPEAKQPDCTIVIYPAFIAETELVKRVKASGSLGKKSGSSDDDSALPPSLQSLFYKNTISVQLQTDTVKVFNFVLWKATAGKVTDTDSVDRFKSIIVKLLKNQKMGQQDMPKIKNLEISTDQTSWPNGKASWEAPESTVDVEEYRCTIKTTDETSESVTISATDPLQLTGIPKGATVEIQVVYVNGKVSESVSEVYDTAARFVLKPVTIRGFSKTEFGKLLLTDPNPEEPEDISYKKAYMYALKDSDGQLIPAESQQRGEYKLATPYPAPLTLLRGVKCTLELIPVEKTDTDVDADDLAEVDSDESDSTVDLSKAKREFSLKKIALPEFVDGKVSADRTEITLTLPESMEQDGRFENLTLGSVSGSGIGYTVICTADTKLPAYAAGYPKLNGNAVEVKFDSALDASLESISANIRVDDQRYESSFVDGPAYTIQLSATATPPVPPTPPNNPVPKQPAIPRPPHPTEFFLVDEAGKLHKTSSNWIAATLSSAPRRNTTTVNVGIGWSQPTVKQGQVISGYKYKFGTPGEAAVDAFASRPSAKDTLFANLNKAGTRATTNQIKLTYGLPIPVVIWSFTESGGKYSYSTPVKLILELDAGKAKMTSESGETTEYRLYPRLKDSTGQRIKLLNSLTDSEESTQLTEGYHDKYYSYTLTGLPGMRFDDSYLDFDLSADELAQLIKSHEIELSQPTKDYIETLGGSISDIDFLTDNLDDIVEVEGDNLENLLKQYVSEKIEADDFRVCEWCHQLAETDYEVNLGNLCSHCRLAIESREGPGTYGLEPPLFESFYMGRKTVPWQDVVLDTFDQRRDKAYKQFRGYDDYEILKDIEEMPVPVAIEEDSTGVVYIKYEEAPDAKRSGITDRQARLMLEWLFDKETLAQIMHNGGYVDGVGELRIRSRDLEFNDTPVLN